MSEEPFQMEWDPADQVKVYHGKVDDEYVIQVSCVLPIAGVELMRRRAFPLLTQSNRAFIDLAIKAEKRLLAADMIKKLQPYLIT